MTVPPWAFPWGGGKGPRGNRGVTKRGGRGILGDERISQLIKRFRPPYIRDVLRRFRSGGLAAKDASAELNLSRARFYKLYASFLRACAQRNDHLWSPGSSGGAHRKPWPKAVLDLVTRLLQAKPPCSYSLVASEALRRFHFQLDRATVRRFALRHHLAPPAPERKRPPVRRWQTQRVGQLWQYDASPHRWFVGQEWQPSLLHLIDDHSRLIVGTRLYERETHLAHLEFLNLALLSTGLPLCLYVDYHSFFFSHLPQAHTQLAAALAFYDVSLRFAPTPQAKGKIERGHQFWQKRLPALFRAENITDLAAANDFLDQLRRHHNALEKHREIGSTPQAAWNRAKKEQRFALRPAPRCPWWPYVFSQRTVIKVSPDGRVPAGSQMLRVECTPGTKVTRCLHPNGDISILKDPPQKGKLPVVLLSTRLV